MLKELSIFVDESGDFGSYEYHNPYYIVTLILHDQSADITADVNQLNDKIRLARFKDSPVHTGPLIRKEDDYEYLPLLTRKRIFNVLYNFTRSVDITYCSIIIEKRQLNDELDLHVQITKHLSALLKKHLEKFIKYDQIIVYYDYGQMELTKILLSVFNSILSNVKFTKAVPMNYRLCQAADMLCSLELLTVKAERKMLTKSELAFFKSERDLYKSYLKAIHEKRLK